ncbi:MAG: M20/M25/M40 family metallo-hydrolase, partial [Planctomycetales bacterium]|nr:M20/M25/M40 family metallo-hydrolase [Planctomycetales bacterium]
MSCSLARNQRRPLAVTNPFFYAVLALLPTVAALPAKLPAAETRSAEAVAAAEARISGALSYLASDDRQGRGIGTEGIDQAADYLAAQFKELGLKTDLFDGGPFQSFTVTASTEMGAKENNRLALVGPATGDGKDAARIEFKLADDYTPLAIGGSDAFDAPLVFVGYGITAPDLEYDDYAGVDVKGKIVVMLRKEPQQGNPHSKFDGREATQHATFMRKAANAYEHGAAAVLMVNDDFDLREKAVAEKKRYQETMGKLIRLNQEFAALESPDEAQFNKHLAEVQKLARQIQEGAEKLQKNAFDRVLQFNEAGAGSRKKMPVLFAARDKIDPAVQAALGKSLAELEREIDKDLTPRSAEMAGWKGVGQAEVISKEATIKNVVGVLEGSGPLANETVIVGAHYDHLGMGGEGTFAPWTVAVHNGADDNASGTTALLEVARQLTSRDAPPRRRIVFIAFSGEERGLLGSAHYVKNPRFPLADTVAMLNMDMVGRLQDNKLIVHGTGTAPQFDVLIDQLNKTYDFQITKKPGGYGPSDHASFYPHNIPVLHFFTGTHKDYHRPSDDADKINVAGVRRIAEMVADATEAVAAADARPTYVAAQRPSIPSSGGDRPYLGTIPDFANDVEGYALQGVAPGGPAEKGGMKSGDVIIQFGESKIGGLEDIDSALRKFKAGDRVPVIVLRDKQKVTLHVVLDP